MAEALSGIGWDHPRCRLALETIEHVGADVTWDYRPLSAFNDQPLRELAEDYDLLVVDYPHVGAAAEEGLLIPLDEAMSVAELTALGRSSIGPCFHSFAYAGKQWALPIDAACHVSASVDHRLAAIGVTRPESWDDVMALAGDCPGLVCLPFRPADAICALLSIQATLARPISDGGGVSEFDATAVEAALAIRSLVPDENADLTPPQALEQMRDGSELSYSPLLFGYSGFSSDPASKIRFGPVPGPGGRGVLGGAGLAISSRSSAIPRAVAFLKTAGSEPTNERMALNGGQPASRDVWETMSTTVPFYADTMAAIEGSYVRPNQPYWGHVQQLLGEMLVEGVDRSMSADTLAAEMNKLIHSVTAGRADSPVK